MDNDVPVESPNKFGRYELTECIALGRTCEVFSATSHGVEGFTRMVLVKRLRGELVNDKTFLDRYLNQIRKLFTLSHANIVQVLDFSQVEQSYFLTEEFIEGYDLATLREMASAGQLTLGTPLGLYIVAEVVKGVEYGHRRLDPITLQPRNLAHGDLHPRNILVSFEGQVKLADFGLWRPNDELDLSTNNQVQRAFLYASPEVAAGDQPTPASDLFSVGLLCVEVCAGRHPYVGKSIKKVRDKALRGQVDKSLINAVPGHFRDMISNALVVEPAERWLDLGVLYDRIMSYLHREHDHAGARALSSFVEDVSDVDLRSAVVYSGVFATDHGSLLEAASNPGQLPTPTTGSSKQLWHTELDIRPGDGKQIPSADIEDDTVPLGVNGRERELEIVREEYDAIEGSHSRVILVSGARGFGKSHLVHQAYQSFQDSGRHAVLLCPGPDSHAIPYGLCLELLAATTLEQPLVWSADPAADVESALDRVGFFDDPARQVIRNLIRLSYDSPAELLEVRQALLKVLATVFSETANDGPLVVLVDDAERADILSLELLHSILGKTGPGPLLLIITSVNRGLLNQIGRAAEPERRVSIVLPPLDRPAVTNILNRASGGTHTESMVDLTAGSPLWALELGIASRAGYKEEKRPDDMAGYLGQFGTLSVELLAALGIARLPLPSAVLAQLLGVKPKLARKTCQRLAALHLIRRGPYGGWTLTTRFLTNTAPTLISSGRTHHIRCYLSDLLVRHLHEKNPLTNPARGRLLALAGARHRALESMRHHAQSLADQGYSDVALNHLDRCASWLAEPSFGSPSSALSIGLDCVELAMASMRLERARQLLSVLLSKAAALGDENGYAQSLAQTARLALREGNFDETRTMLKALYRSVDRHSPLEAQALVYLAVGEWHSRMGNLRRAQVTLLRAYSLLRQRPERLFVLDELVLELVGVMVRRNQHQSANDLIVGLQRDDSGLFDVIKGRVDGEIALFDDRFDLASERLLEAYRTAYRRGRLAACQAMAPHLIEALTENGDYKQARQQLDELTAITQRRDDHVSQQKLARIDRYLTLSKSPKSADGSLKALRTELEQAIEQSDSPTALEVGWLLWRVKNRAPSITFEQCDTVRKLADEIGDQTRSWRMTP